MSSGIKYPGIGESKLVIIVELELIVRIGQFYGCVLLGAGAYVLMGAG